MVSFTSWRQAILLPFVLSTCIGTSRGSRNAERPGPTPHDVSQRPFIIFEDTFAVTSSEAEMLYEQVANASSIAYLLFGAAAPLSHAEGSSNALLPYLTPDMLRLYASRPERCTADIVRQLYELSWSLYGSSAKLQACHYHLYTALGSTFSWVRDNIALRAQEVPGQPLATAMWPDLDLYSELELIMMLAAALSDSDQLDEAAMLAKSRCGIEAEDLAALVPTITDVLVKLHSDLPLLQDTADAMQQAHYVSDQPDQDVRPLPQPDGRRHRRRLRGVEAVVTAARGGAADPSSRRRRLQAGYVYDMPPRPFEVAEPSAMPALLVPLVFTVFLYEDSNGATGPAGYDQAPVCLTRMLNQLNRMSKPTNIQFFIKEIHSNEELNAKLLLPSRSDWLNLPFCPEGAVCLRDESFLQSFLSDWPRSINVFVASDTTSGGRSLGYAYVPASDRDPSSGIVFLSWDSVSGSGYNSPSLYNYGATVLLHELFHHLGLQHPFGPSNTYSCEDDDYVIDTPVSLGPAWYHSFTALTYCLEVFWVQYGGKWDAVYDGMSSRLGVPESDMNAWADSCPTKAGYDELGNYMTYNTPVCFAALGHLTPGQAERVHHMAAELNPVLYAWGQYYAQYSAPPPQASPPPEPYTDICKVTYSNCACKPLWQHMGKWNSYCAPLSAASSWLWCEVDNATACPSCGNQARCMKLCSDAATTKSCNLTALPGAKAPPPPPPRLPSTPPNPPPPPPRAVPQACKVASNGCACRSTWYYGLNIYGTYCSAPDGAKRLWCKVSPECPSYKASPYQSCSPALTMSYCKSEPFYFTTTSVTPLPPARRPPSPPRNSSSSSSRAPKPPSPRPPTPRVALMARPPPLPRSLRPTPPRPPLLRNPSPPRVPRPPSPTPPPSPRRPRPPSPRPRSAPVGRR